jgi:hypothetical protein
VNVIEASHTKLRSYLRGPVRLGVNDPHEPDIVHGGQQPRMVLPEMADANDRNA